MHSAALYARVSTVEQAKGHSINAQIERLRLYAQEHALLVNDEYIDPGFQGDTEDRPALRRLLADGRAGKFDVVLVYRFDRIFRDVRLFLNAEHDLRQHGVRLVSVTEAIEDTHEGRLQLLIKGSFAEYEKAVIRERANMGRIRAAREGKWMGGPPPYGYDLDRESSRLVINEEEARWVGRFFEWLVNDRLSLAQLQRKVNDLKVPTKWEGLNRPRPVNRRGWWMKRSLGRILSREIYSGFYNYRKICKPRAMKRKDASMRPQEEWIRIKVPPIIDERLFRLAQHQLRKNSELSPRRTGRPYLLRRLVECGTCGRVWIATKNNWDKPYYICSGRRDSATSERCTRPSVMASSLEPLVWTSLLDLLQNPDLVLNQVRQRLDQDGTRERKERELHVLSGRIREAGSEELRLIRAYKEGVVNLDTLRQERHETRERIFRLEEERRKLEGELTGWLDKQTQVVAVEQLSRKVLRALPQLTYERRCQVVKELVERVLVRENEIEIHTVLPSTGNDVALRDEPGVDCPANPPVLKALGASIDPTNVVRITLFAPLPESRSKTLSELTNTA